VPSTPPFYAPQQVDGLIDERRLILFARINKQDDEGGNKNETFFLFTNLPHSFSAGQLTAMTMIHDANFS
jgi:hypothetical protein